jgi:predicted secreted acid phosphatase
MLKSARKRVLTAAVALGAALVVGVGGASMAGADQHGAGQATPKHDSSIENLGLVKNEIKAYYGDDGDHQPSADSAYARDAQRVESQLKRWLTSRSHEHGKKALVLDVDDTVLSNYTYEASHDFGYDPATNAACVEAKCFPAVFGMPALVSWASTHGYAVFYVTGRPHDQQQATLDNLADQGFPTPAGIFTKVKTAPYPPYLTCSPNCSTIEYKSGTRAHIESLGYTIVANAGDQYSDLKGGHAQRTFKMPNPMYYLP